MYIYMEENVNYAKVPNDFTQDSKTCKQNGILFKTLKRKELNRMPFYFPSKNQCKLMTKSKQKVVQYTMYNV